MKPKPILSLLSAVSLALGSCSKPDRPGSTESAPKPSDSYPLTTCVVSGEPLGGDMGEPVVYDYKGTTVMFCCKDCIPKFEKEPEKYLAKLK